LIAAAPPVAIVGANPTQGPIRHDPGMAEEPVRVVVLDDYQQVALASGPWERLDGRCTVETRSDHLARTDELVDALRGARVVVAMRERTPFDEERLARLPDLELLVTTGMGNAAIDLQAAERNGVVVCGTRGRGRHTVELAWALILALLRSIPQEDAHIRAGGWQHTIGTELDGATLGLVGLGRLGSAMVPVAKAFGMDVIAWSQNLEPAHAGEAGARAVGKQELFASADVVSIHYKLSPRSTGIVGAADIAAMKPTAYVVNTSRGPIVDTPALLRALHDGAIAGAALDVFDREPLPADDPLRSAPRTVLSPHLGYVTRENYAVFFADVVADIEAWLDGGAERRLSA
jgi:phosphoglycerate dehydrogenase-like enzyme